MLDERGPIAAVKACGVLQGVHSTSGQNITCPSTFRNEKDIGKAVNYWTNNYIMQLMRDG